MNASVTNSQSGNQSGTEFRRRLGKLCIDNLGILALAVIWMGVLVGCGGEKEIELTEEERQIGALKEGAVARASRNALVLLDTREKVVEFADEKEGNGVDANDAFTMTSSLGGIVGLVGDASSSAKTESKLVQGIKDMLAHQKVQMNTNAGDLDLVFALDYSGSMSDDIQEVINGLESIVDSLGNVFQSGRNVRIGLSTFGQAGKEKVELDFTDDPDVLKTHLKRLRADYDRDSHSTDPGEANYRGLKVAATGMSWTAQNRMFLAITDEGSFELQTQDTAAIKEAEDAAKTAEMQITTYTILTP